MPVGGRYGGLIGRHALLAGQMESRRGVHWFAESLRRSTRFGSHLLCAARYQQSHESGIENQGLLLGHSAAGRLLGMLWPSTNVKKQPFSTPNIHFLSHKPRFLPSSYHHTISATLLYGLREALAGVCAEGLQETIRRHEDAAAHLYEGLTKLGLELYVNDPKVRLPTITSIKLPSNCDWKKVIDFAANE